MIYIEAPNEYDGDGRCVFLAGSVSGGIARRRRRNDSQSAQKELTGWQPKG